MKHPTPVCIQNFDERVRKALVALKSGLALARGYAEGDGSEYGQKVRNEAYNLAYEAHETALAQAATQYLNDVKELSK